MIGLFARWRFRRRLIAAVMDLPVLVLAVFIDHVRHSLSYEEIAARHGLEPLEVRLLLSSALTELDATLFPDEGG